MAKLSRLGIFVFYDPQGIVDDYILYLMQALQPHLSRIVVISNTELDKTAKERLEKYSDAVFVRENYGLDAAAFKEGLVSFCGWEEVEKYDEVVLINDTFWGPIHSFDKMFSEMAQKDVDFWGISAGYHALDGWNRVKYGYAPDHIQTFFVAFRKCMVCTEAFHSYWDNYDDTMNDFVSVVTQHEVVMTKHFQDLGFHWAIYADTQRYRSKYCSENFNIYHYHAHTMMRDMKFPVLKKKVLNINVPDQLSIQDLECSADAMEYIQNETEYDTRLIWDHALRLYNVTDLYYTLHLNYVLPSIPVDIPAKRKIALVYRISNLFFAELFCKHASQLSALLEVYIIPEDETIKQCIAQIIGSDNQITVLNPSRQKTEMGGFVLCCKELTAQYDYLGYIHDATNPEHYPTAAMESSVYGYLQNAANDSAYVSQIINCFETHPRLGILGTPFPLHNNGFDNYGNGWADCFDGAKKLASKLGLSCNLNEEKLPFMITGCFWCRTDAIRNIWNRDWAVHQFFINPVTNTCHMNEILKRILPYAAQSERYYSGIVIHTNYASMRISNQQYMLTQIIITTQKQLGCRSPRYKGYIEQLNAIRSGNCDSPLMMDISQFSMAKIVQIYLEQHMPPWITQRVKRLHGFLQTILSKRKE